LSSQPNDTPVQHPSSLSGAEADIHRLLVALIKLALVDEPSEAAAWRTDALVVQGRIAAGFAEIGTSRLDTLWSMAVKVAERDPAVRRAEVINPILPTMSPLSFDVLKALPFELDPIVQSIRDVSSFG